MTFSHPWVLLLLAVPVLLGWSIVARRPGVVAPVDFSRARERPMLRALLGAFEVVPLLLLAVAVVLLAGPQTMQQPRRERSLTNIQICLDVSGSMGGRNHELAKKAIEEFTLAREGDAFGLTFFGVAQVRWLPLTKDLQAIRDALPFADPFNQPSHMGGTMIGAALRFCGRNMVAESGTGDRMIVLVSDGYSADLGDGVAEEIGEELRESGIVVYHVHIDESEVPAEVRDLVEVTGGEAFAATDASSLRAIFSHIDKMKPARLAPAGTVPLDEFGPFAAIALGLLGLNLVSLLGVRHSPW
ncbi:MAG: VWA domain-containing protein [Phycisphaerae bacterium]|nr:VWA domain-containing protein [Phycisphaerae bacterium]